MKSSKLFYNPLQGLVGILFSLLVTAQVQAHSHDFGESVSVGNESIDTYVSNRGSLIDRGVFIADPLKVVEGESVRKHFKAIKEQGALDLSLQGDKGYWVYGDGQLESRLKKIGVPFDVNQIISIDGQNGPDLSGYGFDSLEETYSKITKIDQAHPDFKVEIIGQSVLGRPIPMIVISKGPNELVNSDFSERLRFAIIGGVHGNERPSVDIPLMYVETLLTWAKNNDPRYRELLATTDVYIIPVLSPDSVALLSRATAMGYDPNRKMPSLTSDFTGSEKNPIQFSPITKEPWKSRQDMWNYLASSDKYPPEIRALLGVEAKLGGFHFSFAAHTGDKVLNLPFDNSQKVHRHNGILEAMSNKIVKLTDGFLKTEAFPKGWTNGYAWYPTDNNLQDANNYEVFDGTHFTWEFSVKKSPSKSETIELFSIYKDAIHYAATEGTWAIARADGFWQPTKDVNNED